MRRRSLWQIPWAVGSLGLLGMILGVWHGGGRLGHTGSVPPGPGTGPADEPFIALAAPTSVALGVRLTEEAGSPEETPPMLAVAQAERGRVLWWTHRNVRYVLEFLRPVGVALDAMGRLWVGEDALNAVFSISARGRQLDFRCWQDVDLLDRPVEFAFGEGAVLILDNGKGHVLRMEADGPREVLIGGLISPTALQLVREPTGFGYRLFVTDMGLPSYFQKNRPVVRVYQTDLRQAQVLREYGQGHLEYPVAFIVEDDFLDVLDGHLSQRLQLDLRTGDLLGQTGEYGTGPDQWRNPSDMAALGPCRVIADTGNDRLVLMVKQVPAEGCRWAMGSTLVEWRARLHRCEPAGTVVADRANSRDDPIVRGSRP